MPSRFACFGRVLVALTNMLQYYNASRTAVRAEAKRCYTAGLYSQALDSPHNFSREVSCGFNKLAHATLRSLSEATSIAEF